MRIVIDLQAAQASNADRGIGRYSLALAKSLAKNRGEHSIFIALSAAFPDSIARIRKAFDGLLPSKNICIWYPVGGANFIDPDNAWMRKSSEVLREAFLANLKPDVVLVSSMFEGPGDDAVTSVGLFDNETFVVSILYDLIPYIYPDVYLKSEILSKWYLEKINHLKRAKIQLAISDSSRGESIQYLATDPRYVFNISAAIDPIFKPIEINNEARKALQTRLGLKGRFLLYTGGIDHRKNIEGLIRAFALLRVEDRRQLQLAIVCSISEDNRSRLRELGRQSGLHPDEVIFTGFVPDEELLVLYNLCEFFVFPSWHEGFGLPALEAMACGKAVIASNCSSLPEVVGRADALFDPHDEQAIAEKMALLLNDHSFRAELERHALLQAKNFSWDASAISALKVIGDSYSKYIFHNKALSENQPRPKLAYLSPLPPERSGISDYSADLLPVLAQYYDIELIIDQEIVSPPWIKRNCTLRSTDWFKQHADIYDRVLYHFGNSHFHQHMFELIQDVPGVIVLHDFFLSGIICHMSRSGLAPTIWDDTLYESHGYRALAERYASGDDWAGIVEKYPCNLPVLQSAYGVIVHSEHSRQLADIWYGELASQKWAVIPLLRTPPGELGVNVRRSTRTQLGYRDDQFIVCSFGFIASTKLAHKIIEAWENSALARDERCVLVFVGATDNSDYSHSLASKIQRSKMKSQIVITGWASADLYRDYLTIADLAVQLRKNSRGETSAAVLDCMNYGLATIVNAHGSMGDLHEDGVWMLNDNFEIQHLVDAMEALFRDKARRTSLGGAARSILQKRHDPGECARQYFQTIESFYAEQKNGIQSILKSIAKIEGHFVFPDLAAVAIDKSIPPNFHPPQLLLDVTGLIEASKDSNAVLDGEIIFSLLNIESEYRIEPIYLKDEKFHYARKFVAQQLRLNFVQLWDDPICARPLDVYIGSIFHKNEKSIFELEWAGVLVNFVEDLWSARAICQVLDVILNINKIKSDDLLMN